VTCPGLCHLTGEQGNELTTNDLQTATQQDCKKTTILDLYALDQLRIKNIAKKSSKINIATKYNCKGYYPSIRNLSINLQAIATQQ